MAGTLSRSAALIILTRRFRRSAELAFQPIVIMPFPVSFVANLPATLVETPINRSELLHEKVDIVPKRFGQNLLLVLVPAKGNHLPDDSLLIGVEIHSEVRARLVGC